jgi:hypothetical protein
LIKTAARASRASNAAEVQKNADGSVHIYFARRRLVCRRWPTRRAAPVPMHRSAPAAREQRELPFAVKGTHLEESAIRR